MLLSKKTMHLLSFCILLYYSGAGVGSDQKNTQIMAIVDSYFSRAKGTEIRCKTRRPQLSSKPAAPADI